MSTHFQISVHAAKIDPSLPQIMMPLYCFDSFPPRLHHNILLRRHVNGQSEKGKSGQETKEKTLVLFLQRCCSLSFSALLFLPLFFPPFCCCCCCCVNTPSAVLPPKLPVKLPVTLLPPSLAALNVRACERLGPGVVALCISASMVLGKEVWRRGCMRGRLEFEPLGVGAW